MIYLDNSATTQPFSEVLESFYKVATDYFGNPSSLHGLGVRSEQLLNKSRQQIAKLMETNVNEIIFTSGGSEGNNLAIKGVAFEYHARGKHIITTSVEHPSVSNACEQLARLGYEITYLPVDKDGIVSVENLKNELRDDTILVSIIHVNNEVGSIQPVEEIGKLLKNYPKILFHVDHVQGIGKVPLNLKKSNIDLCTISGHKFNGLKGTGAIYIREGVRLSPLIAGGGQEMEVRSGTENVPGIVAMAKALRITLENQVETQNELIKIKTKYYEALSKFKQIVIHTPIEKSAPHILNFSVNGLKPEVFVHLLEEEEIFVSTTSACSSKKNLPSKTLLAMGIPESIANSSIRISLSKTNHLDEVPFVVSTMDAAIRKLEKVMR